MRALNTICFHKLNSRSAKTLRLKTAAVTPFRTGRRTRFQVHPIDPTSIASKATGKWIRSVLNFLMFTLDLFYYF